MRGTPHAGSPGADQIALSDQLPKHLAALVVRTAMAHRRPLGLRPFRYRDASPVP